MNKAKAIQQLNNLHDIAVEFALSEDCVNDYIFDAREVDLSDALIEFDFAPYSKRVDSGNDILSYYAKKLHTTSIELLHKLYENVELKARSTFDDLPSQDLHRIVFYSCYRGEIEDQLDGLENCEELISYLRKVQKYNQRTYKDIEHSIDCTLDLTDRHCLAYTYLSDFVEVYASVHSCIEYLNTLEVAK